MGLNEKLHARGPKKLLALDGGGIRGLISVEILAAIERIVGQPLSSYFDYVAGTSTGAILAACVALGMSVDEIRRIYLETGPTMFDRASPLRRFRYRYEETGLAAALREAFAGLSPKGEDLKLGSPALQTLLLLVMRNATTDSPWFISNNPHAMFNDRSRDDCNLEIPLWRLVRASTAAPTYFPPERVQVGPQEFLFVDGGITTYNHPGFLLFLHATLEPYRLRWPAEPDKLLLVSVGTGMAPDANANLKPGDMNILYNAESIPAALVHAALAEQDTLCRIFGRCLHGGPIDMELGDLRWTPGGASTALPKLFTYLRYTADISGAGLERLGLGRIPPQHVQRLDSVEHLEELQQIGRAAAKEVLPAHFEAFA